ncbi:MAG: response regulator transcription factor [Pseudomonadota bacterium]|nr:response regulator transcription factor [Pseudomonadota bacterium]
MRLLLAYENSLSRDYAARHLAEADPDVRITTAASLAEGIDLANRLPSLDTVALDLEMPDMEGLTGLRRFRQQCRHPAPVALTGAQPGGMTANALIAAGGAGFLPYHMSPDALLGALRILAAGALPACRHGDAARGPAGDIILTMREHDVLSGLRSGLSNKEIADNLSLSEVTVKHHIKSLRGKLGARNRVTPSAGPTSSISDRPLPAAC